MIVWTIGISRLRRYLWRCSCRRLRNWNVWKGYCSKIPCVHNNWWWARQASKSGIDARDLLRVVDVGVMKTSLSVMWHEQMQAIPNWNKIYCIYGRTLYGGEWGRESCREIFFRLNRREWDKWKHDRYDFPQWMSTWTPPMIVYRHLKYRWTCLYFAVRSTIIPTFEICEV